MYKATHDSHDYLKRVASHSTKPYRNGRVEILPPNAQEPQTEYLTATEQIAHLESVRDQIRAAIPRVCKSRRKILIEELRAMNSRLSDLGSLKALARKASRKPSRRRFSQVFHHVAKLHLTPIVYAEIEREVLILMNAVVSDESLPKKRKPE